MIVGMVFAGKSVLFVVFIALVGFFLYAMRSVLQAWAIESMPKNLAGAGVGLQFGCSGFGAAISPSIFGMIADATISIRRSTSSPAPSSSPTCWYFFCPTTGHETGRARRRLTVRGGVCATQEQQ